MLDRILNRARNEFDKFKKKTISLYDSFSINKEPKVKFFSNKNVFYSITVFNIEYIELIEKVVFRSLLQDGNIPALKEKHFNQIFYIYTSTKEELLHINKKISHSKLNDFLKTKVKIISRKHRENEKIYLKRCHSASIQDSIENDALHVFLAPDIFFGNYSIKNMVELSYSSNIGFASNAVRVTDKFIDILDKNKKNFSNSDLLSLSLGTKNNLVSNKNKGLEFSKINDEYYKFINSRLSVNFVRYNSSDLKFFKRQKDFNSFDFDFPRKLLKEHRYKVVLNPDFFFFLEFTNESLLKDKITVKKDLIYAKTSRNLAISANEIVCGIWKS
ncbi:hypothetical protein N9E32_02900 [Alphaproteobacteria bacterium]|nr:hypothetical protein [Alphaproteobacteria bacterium]